MAMAAIEKDKLIAKRIEEGRNKVIEASNTLVLPKVDIDQDSDNSSTKENIESLLLPIKNVADILLPPRPKTPNINVSFEHKQKFDQIYYHPDQPVEKCFVANAARRALMRQNASGSNSGGRAMTAPTNKSRNMYAINNKGEVTMGKAKSSGKKGGGEGFGGSTNDPPPQQTDAPQQVVTTSILRRSSALSSSGTPIFQQEPKAVRGSTSFGDNGNRSLGDYNNRNDNSSKSRNYSGGNSSAALRNQVFENQMQSMKSGNGGGGGGSHRQHQHQKQQFNNSSNSVGAVSRQFGKSSLASRYA